MRSVILPMLMIGLWVGASAADEFRLLAWNVESNRPDSSPVSDELVIGEQLTELMRDPATRSQIVCLSEVDPRTAFHYKKAIAEGLGAEVDMVTSASGGYRDLDSLVLVVDLSRFRIDEVNEIHRYSGIAANFNVPDTDSPEYGTMRARSPLAAKIYDQKTKRSFWLIVNHLARGEADLRTEQAKMLRQWAIDHSEMPVISAGDFNFDFDFHTQKGNPGFDAMFEGNVWQWLKPDPLIDSNWADDRNAPPGQRKDRYPDSILDFVLVANQAKEWGGEADIVVRPNDFPDNERTSDHRPTLAVFKPK